VTRLIAILVALCTWSLAAAAGAEASDETFDQHVLDVLLEQGVISQSQHEELSREAQAEREAAQAAESPTVSANQNNGDGWREYWKEGFRIESEDGLFELKFGGRIHLDAAYVAADDDLNDWAKANPPPPPPDAPRGNLRGFGAEVRRARLFMQGNLYEHGIFKLDLAFEGAEVTPKDIWVGLRRVPVVGVAQAGHFIEPFSLERLTSSNFLTFTERSLPTNAFNPDRNLGIAFHNNAFNKRMTWSVGGFTETDEDRREVSNQSNYNVTARVTGAPFYADGGRKLVHLGVSYSHKFINGDIQFDSREVELSEDLVDTGPIPANGTDLLSLELAAVLGPLSLQGEWMSSWVDQVAGPDLYFTGAYAQVSWFVTGEHRPYKKCFCSFGRVKLKRRFAPAEGDWGALELAARYSYLDLSDENIRGGTQNNTTLGANWYLYSNLRLMANWVHSHRNGIGDQNAVVGRISIDF
jgi:phosphate-selective porin OprO/OprP